MPPCPASVLPLSEPATSAEWPVFHFSLNSPQERDHGGRRRVLFCGTALPALENRVDVLQGNPVFLSEQSGIPPNVALPDFFNLRAGQLQCAWRFGSQHQPVFFKVAAEMMGERLCKGLKGIRRHTSTSMENRGISPWRSSYR